MSDELEVLVYEIQAWALKIFPDETPRDILLHLVEELGEASKAIGTDKISEELADIFMLTVCLAAHASVDICAAVKSKHEVNKNRTWKNGANGYRHA